MKMLIGLVTLCVLCCVCNADIQQDIKDMKAANAEMKAKNRETMQLMRDFRASITEELDIFKIAIRDKIADLKAFVKTNKVDLLQTVRGQIDDISGDMDGLRGTFTTTKDNLISQLTNLRTKITTEKEANKASIQTLRESIMDTRNMSRVAVKAVTDNMREYKQNMTGVIADVRATSQEKVRNLRDYVNEGKVNTTNLIRDLKTIVQDNKNESNTRFQESKDQWREYKTDVKDLMTAMRLTMDENKQDMADQLSEMQEQNDKYRGTIKGLARQTMLLQFGVEESVRTDGDSGIKVTRGMSKGPDNYYESGLFGPNLNMIHDHSDYERTMGMGEVVTVLNGVEFKTRHNDYKLLMPSTTSTDFHATEDIPFPGVPPAVTGTVDEQITEMREWFKAFATQNKTHRNYPEYFKPVLCYMEGSWTLDSELSEPFASDRHAIDASTWFDLQEKVRFASYTGTKSRLENFANLPTTIMSVNDTTGLPEYAQWNYRILCKPINEDMPTKDFRQMDDLAFRVPRKRSQSDVNMSRGGRYRLYTEDEDKYTQYSKLDRLFYTIPGNDNIPGNLSQVSFGDRMIDMGSDDETPLNTGFYHRFFKFGRSGAMGIRDVARGFNDANLFVAQTSQERIAPVKIKDCKKNGLNCEMTETRFTYAIPLEVVYMTPLLTWNPYDFDTEKTYEEVTAGGRNGRLDPAKAYNGTGPIKGFYMTPLEFFQGKVDQTDPADTVRNAVGVLDKQGIMRKVTPSGTKIFLQEIEGIEGRIRLRYPISPIHGEGSPVWKELNALKKIVKDQGAAEGITATSNMIIFMMHTTTQDPPGEHNHEFGIDMETFMRLDRGEDIEVETSISHGHRHTLTVHYKESKDIFLYTLCDGEENCADGHPRKIMLITDVEHMMDNTMMTPMPSMTAMNISARFA